MFGVAIFSVLIMAGSFLFEITRYLSEGADLGATLQLVALLLPGVMAKTFAMAMLLGTLLAFGRLSGDSEIVALKAAGASMARIMTPIVVFGLIVGGIAFTFNNFVVPGASYRAWLLKEDIKDKLDDKRENATSRALYEDGKLQGFIMAKSFDIVNRTLNDAVIVMVDEESRPKWTVSAEKLVYNGEQDWLIRGEARVDAAGGKTSIVLKDGAWPAEIAKPRFTPEDLYLQEIRDLDALSMNQLAAQIARERLKPRPSTSTLANWEFGYWNKVALPLAALVFGLVGAPLGIRSHRTSTASGFWLSVIIIFAYMLLSNVLAIMSQNQVIPAWTASFGPITIGLLASVFLIHQKNT
jgi:lipopolysaccharide export system permease protein